MMRSGKEDEEHQRHPTEQADLECGQRRYVGLGGFDQALAQTKAAHRGDGEVLKHSAQREGSHVVTDVLGGQGSPPILAPMAKITSSATMSPECILPRSGKRRPRWKRTGWAGGSPRSACRSCVMGRPQER
jgi:hypothetical protein